MARDLRLKLGYKTWENFEEVIHKAMDSCRNSGVEVSQHFREATKMLPIGNGSSRPSVDYFLTKHAAHLIAMVGDASKPEIAFAQMYFSVQTLKQELHEQMTDEDRRIAYRDRVKSNFKKLSGAAMDSGVTRPGMPIFHAAGYQGMYDGLNKSDILAAKGLPPKEDLMDRAGATELAAHEFRMTQTKDVLERQGKIGEQAAVNVHRTIGRKVREAITAIGGTMPENLPAEPSIKKIEAARRKQEKLAAKLAPKIAEP